MGGGGDWKFLAIICGLNAANAEYSCIWCKCPSGDRWNTKKEWSISDTTKGARTISEIQSLSKEPARKKFGCLKMPIFSSIPIDHIIIDTLHLFLRIGDLLINLLIMELRRQDGIDKQRTLRLDQTHLASYETFLNEECKISFQWYADEQKLKYRDLTGPEKHRLFHKINISTLFPSIPKASDIQELWSSFYILMQMLSNDCVADVFDRKAKTWVNDFCAIYQTKHVTPYAHALSMHVSQLIQLHGNISKFSEQGLEKLNDLTTKHYLRSTNHRETEALHQLIQKRKT